MSRQEPKEENLTELAFMLGRARKTAPPPEFGSGTQLGDPRQIVPLRGFERARQVKPQWRFMIPETAGVYNKGANTIDINQFEHFLRQPKQGWVNPQFLKEGGPSKWAYMPAVFPHEIGHAIYEELVDNADEHSGALDLINEWKGLHQRFLTNNKALGNYKYADYKGFDNSWHSFADAFSAWVIDPDKFKNLFPEMNSYFEKLTGEKRKTK